MYIFWAIAIFVIGISIFRFKVDKDLYKNKPLPFTVMALSAIVLNWMLYLFGFYASINDTIADMIFLPIWFLVSVLALIAALKEHKNNLFMGLLTGGLSIITLVVGALLFLIGRM